MSLALQDLKDYVEMIVNLQKVTKFNNWDMLEPNDKGYDRGIFKLILSDGMSFEIAIHAEQNIDMLWSFNLYIVDDEVFGAGGGDMYNSWMTFEKSLTRPWATWLDEKLKEHTLLT